MLLLLATLMLSAAWSTPDAPLGRVVRKVLIEAPARWLNEIALPRTLIVLVLVVAAVGLLALFRAEGALMLASGVPDVIAWSAVFDVGSVLDLLAAVAVVGVVARLRTIGAAARFVLRRMTARARSRRPRQRRRPSQTAANDDGEPEPALLIAA